MKKLTAFELKTVAIAAMLINHIGHTFDGIWLSPTWRFAYLTIGLLTFPIMAYLLVEGFHYTRSRWRYAGRLGFFACLSFIPFNALTQGILPLLPSNNILFTLMIGVLMMMACEAVKHPILQVLVLLFATGLTLMSDWMIFGMPIIFGFYKTHGKPKASLAVPAIACAAMLWFNQGNLIYDPISVYSTLGLLAVIPLLALYNGQRGYAPRWLNWGFYAFYPLHLAILWGVRFVMFGY